MPTERMGPPLGALPPMRLTASWSGSNHPTAYKFVARRYAPMASSPRILCRPAPTGARRLCKSPIAVHRRCACSGVKALRNTSPAKRQAAKLCYRFGSLTPSARSANLIVGDGTKNGFPASNKEPPTNQKHDLTEKAPYKVRIQLPPAESRMRTLQRCCDMHGFSSCRGGGRWPALNLALGHGMIGCTAQVLDVAGTEPFGQIAGVVAGTVVGQEPRALQGIGLVQPTGLQRQV